MVPKHWFWYDGDEYSFRAVLFRMVPKPSTEKQEEIAGFRAVLFRMVPKLQLETL